MAFNVNDFRNKFTNGGARPTQFEMQILWPTGLAGAQVAAAQGDFRFLCQVSELPASTVKEIEVPYFGRKLKYAGDRTFGSTTVTILNDENFEIRNSLELWLAAIQGHQTTLSQFNGGNVNGGYATNGTVTQYSRNSGGSAIAGYQFVGMFPTAVSAIALDWSKTDTVEDFTCEFMYQYWLPVNPNTGAVVSPTF